jgi:hypothetical protein
VTVRIYVEGGFEGSTKSNCRKAFSTFLAKVIRPESFKVIASGSRTQAFQDFCSALRQRPGEYNILLVDSETAVTKRPWQHLREREGDNWPHPEGATDEQAHLMVQVMEAWFLADQDTLATFYRQGFLKNSLPRQKNIEKLDKRRVFESLSHASKDTQKGSYHKTRHGFELLELIDPTLVRAASGHADQLFVVLQKKTTGQVSI